MQHILQILIDLRKLRGPGSCAQTSHTKHVKSEWKMGSQEERGPSNHSAQKYLFANDLFVLDQKFIIAVSKDMSWSAHTVCGGLGQSLY